MITAPDCVTGKRTAWRADPCRIDRMLSSSHQGAERQGEGDDKGERRRGRGRTAAPVRCVGGTSSRGPPRNKFSIPAVAIVVMLALGWGVTAVVEPGGSRNDQEIVDAANEHGVALVFAGDRHFRH